MAAVTQTIPNFLGGVSNQPDDKKLPGQVKEALNVYPDPTFGLQKRPGLKFLKELTDGSSAFDQTDLDKAEEFNVWINKLEQDDKDLCNLIRKDKTFNNEFMIKEILLKLEI